VHRQYSCSQQLAALYMTKYFLVHLLILIISTSTAQQHKWEYGFQGGINLNTAYGSSISKQYRDQTVGLSVGGNLKLNTSAHFGVKVLPSYDVYGWAYRDLLFESDILSGSKSESLYKLHYLNLPLLASYSFGNKVKVNVEAGMWSGLLLHSTLVIKTKYPSGAETVTRNTSNSFKNINAGLSAGIGMQVPLTSRMALGVQVRNTTGLTNISKAPASTPNISDIKTLTFSALTGLSFNL
jgi:opacity protein-like surface antigen